jgi:hypothetical protein
MPTILEKIFSIPSDIDSYFVKISIFVAITSIYFVSFILYFLVKPIEILTSLIKISAILEVPNMLPRFNSSKDVLVEICISPFSTLLYSFSKGSISV